MVIDRGSRGALTTLFASMSTNELTRMNGSLEPPTARPPAYTRSAPSASGARSSQKFRSAKLGDSSTMLPSLDSRAV